MQMRAFTASELRRELSAILDAVETGEKIRITRRGQSIAVIRPAKKSDRSPA
jgi:prevent-host-death family protein